MVFVMGAAAAGAGVVSAELIEVSVLSASFSFPASLQDIQSETIPASVA